MMKDLTGLKNDNVDLNTIGSTHKQPKRRSRKNRNDFSRSTDLQSGVEHNDISTKI